MKMTLHHIGYAATDLSETIDVFKRILGFKVVGKPFLDNVQKVNEAFVSNGETLIQIVEPISEDSPISNFLKKRGNGLHHLAFEVENITDALDEFKSNGANVICEPFKGFDDRTCAFIDPRSVGRLLIELTEAKK
ncbi:MAG: VOC family protein [Candidatus Omnitrophica bacterium]|nr:VOC family protein [Candidatus Omnitrophota bacterium]